MATRDVRELTEASVAYSLLASSYDELQNPMLSLEQRVVRALLPDLNGKDIVDLGCGTGRWLRELASRTNSAIGIDASAEMLQIAERRVPSDCTLMRASCPPIPLRPESADIVLCSFLTSYVADVHALAEEIRRIARPGGMIFVSDLHPKTVCEKGWRREFRLGEKRIEVATKNWSLEFLLDTFSRVGLKLNAVLEPAFGSPELDILERAGKLDASASASPAIFVLHFVNESPKQIAEGPATIQRVLSGRLALDARATVTTDFEIENGRLEFIGAESWRGGAEVRRNAATIDLHGLMVLPGLVNAHDHLEFALFPRLGRGGYANCQQWAKDVYHPESSPVREHRSVPKDVRLWWGGLRNLLAGVTSVCHHNPYVPEVFGAGFPLQVLRDFRWTHSLAFKGGDEPTETNDVPFILHLGEGVDEASSQELDTLAAEGALNKNLVVVHGLALDEDSRELLNSCGASLVWCPTSNEFLFGRTHTSREIAQFERVAIGSDSSLTASGDLLDEITHANKIIGVPADALYRQATTVPASILGMREGQGSLRPGALADFIAVRDAGADPADTLVALTYRDIELVVVGGVVQLASTQLISRLPETLSAGLFPLEVDRLIRFVRAPLGWMFNAAERSPGCTLTMNGRSLRHVASSWL